MQERLRIAISKRRQLARDLFDVVCLPRMKRGPSLFRYPLFRYLGNVPAGEIGGAVPVSLPASLFRYLTKRLVPPRVFILLLRFATFD